MTGQDRPAPGVVQVRLSGHPDDADALAAVLATIPAVQILTGPDGPYPNRRQPGHRLYLTLRLTQPPSKPEPGRTTPHQPDRSGPDEHRTHRRTRQIPTSPEGRPPLQRCSALAAVPGRRGHPGDRAGRPEAAHDEP